MASLAKAILIGNAGRDAELRMTDGGQAVAEFSMAVNRKSRGVDTTDWYRVSCWGKTAEVAQQYVKKGGMVSVVGNLSQSRYTDKKSGEARVSIDVNCDSLTLLGSKREDAAPAPDTDGVPF